MENKRGPYSAEDKAYIAEMAPKQTSTQIALKMGRNAGAVDRYIKKHGLVPGDKISPHALEINNDIRKSPHWKQLKKQFDDNELELFVYHWNNMLAQFKDDVLHTEELQIIDTIRLTLLMDRILVEERDTKVSINRLETLITIEESKSIELQDPIEINLMEKQLSFARSAMTDIGKSFRDMLDKKNNMLKSMKATREARIKILESSKETLTGWMRQVLSDSKLRNILGIRMEKMRLAADYNAISLSEWHIYEDGVADRPLLNEHTVQEDEE